jgi:hypothetical protein
MFEETEKKEKEEMAPESLPVEPAEAPEAPEIEPSPAEKPPAEIEPKVAEAGPRPVPEPAPGPEDIFAETEPKAMPKLVPEEAELRARELVKAGPRVRFPFKRILITLVTLAVIAGVVYGGWLAYKGIKGYLEERGIEEGLPAGGEETEILWTAPGEKVYTERSEVPLDTDGDGLPDKEEETLGTGINVVDTDRDGLFDGEEVKIYQTNPLKADSDGDGYSDGTEVKNGYDPLDPTPGARLFNLKEEIDKIK